MNSNKKKKEERDTKEAKYKAAITAYEKGEFNSVNACSVAFGVHQRSLDRFIKSGTKFVGKGKKSNVFTIEEEKRKKFSTDFLLIKCRLTYQRK